MSKQSSSLISVILPVYKGAEWLRESIESILQQQFTEFELIIVNDASPDNSYDIIKTFTDARIKYLEHSENKGLVAALNTGLNAAVSKYVARMDQDDISLPHRLQMQFDYMEANPSCVLLGTQVSYPGSNQQSRMYTKSSHLKAALTLGTSFCHPTVMIRSDVLKRNNLQYEERFKHAEDYGLWTELSKHGDITNLQTVCLEYRKHTSQYTKIFREETLRAVRYIRNHYLTEMGIILTEKEMKVLQKLIEKQFDYGDDDLFNEAGLLLKKIPGFFLSAKIPLQDAKEVYNRFWKQLCGRRVKEGYPSYSIYSKHTTSFFLADLTTHAWFWKKGILKKKVK